MLPAIVLLAGFPAPLVMLVACLIAITAGFAIYNQREWLGGRARPALTRFAPGSRARHS